MDRGTLLDTTPKACVDWGTQIIISTSVATVALDFLCDFDVVAPDKQQGSNLAPSLSIRSRPSRRTSDIFGIISVVEEVGSG